MGIDPVLARKRIDDAAQRVAATEEKLQAESAENRKAYERFRNQLALFSGGTIALSVTFLGYLKALPRPVVSPSVLMASWGSLLVGLLSSLFYAFFYTHYIHFARLREYVERRSQQRETQAKELIHLNIVNVRSESERAALKERLRDAAKGYDKDAAWAKRREDAYSWVWKWDGRLARGAFFLGLTLLLIFAVRNI